MASRHDLFNVCKEAAVENLKKNLKYSTFVSCLPAAVQKDEAFCKSIHQKLIDEVTSGLRESTDELSLKVGLKHKLDLLDKIVADPANATTDRSPAWRPPPNAHLDNQSLRDRGSLVAARDNVEVGVVNDLNSQLKRVEHELASISNEVDEAAGEISRVVSDLANIAETTDHDQKDEDGDEKGEKMVEGQETQTS